MAKYLLACSCGNQIVVEDGQAGGSAACECGKSLNVPPLRKLRDLPPASEQISEVTVAWSARQGVQTASLLAALVLVAVTAYLWWTMPVIKDFDAEQHGRQVESVLEDMTPSLAYQFWIVTYKSLAATGFEEEVPTNIRQIEAEQQRYKTYMLSAASLGGLFLIIAAIAATTGKN